MKQANGQFDAVGGGSVNGGSKGGVVFFNVQSFDGVCKRDCMAGGGAFGGGGAYAELAEMADGFMEFGDSASVDSVVVAE